MTLIILLALALFAAVTFKVVGFLFAVTTIAFKIGVVAFVGWMLWNCVKVMTGK